MIQIVPMALAILSFTTGAVTLGAETWTATTPAGALVAHEPMRGLVRSLQASDGAILAIRHASAEADRARALALHSALVALGIPSPRLRLEPAAAAPGVLIVELIDSGSRSP